MANENWHILGDKMRNYRPAVDADAAWQGVLDQLNVTPQPLSLRRLLAWKVAEMGLLVFSLFVFSWTPPQPAVPAVRVEPAQVQKDRVSIGTLPTKPTAETNILPPMSSQGSAKRALSPSVNRVAEPRPKPVFATASRFRRADDLVLEKQNSYGIKTEVTTKRLSSLSPVRLPATTSRSPSTEAVAPLAGTLPQGVVRSNRTNGLGITPSFPSNDLESFDPGPADAITQLSWEILGGAGRTVSTRIAPFVGMQLRYAVGPRSSLVLGAAYQRVGGMELYWHQAEYDKDFGYPTGNAVERWLDSYGAWEYSIDYRRQIVGGLALQTGVQLTVLQERGLRERIQGSDFFLGSSRRSLVDRDFGVRFGLDYRLSRNWALYSQYLYGLGDISPNYLYASKAVHRHGGFRIGLRFTPFK